MIGVGERSETRLSASSTVISGPAEEYPTDGSTTEEADCVACDQACAGGAAFAGAIMSACGGGGRRGEVVRDRKKRKMEKVHLTFGILVKL